MVTGTRRWKRGLAALLITLGMVGAIVVKVHSGPTTGTRDAVSAGARSGDNEKRQSLARYLSLLQRTARAAHVNRGTPDRPVTVDERIQQRAEDDPVALLIPALAGTSKQRQLESLKAMMSWPDHKFLFQIPTLAGARHLAFEERIEIAENLGRDLIGSLESQGYRYDLPPGFVAVASSQSPDTPFGAQSSTDETLTDKTP